MSEVMPTLTDAMAREMVGQCLHNLGVPRAGVLLVHSAFKRLARAGFRAEPFVAALADYMAAGTLLMPAMSWHAVNPANPVFDELATPSITGVLTELFRTRFATHRSLHPTHSVAGLGAHLDALLGSHHLDDTPCSARSPWGLLAGFDANLLLLGVEMDSCTLIHHVEETIAPELYFRPERERYLCRDRQGREVEVVTRRTLRLPRDFWQFEEALAAEGGVRRHKLAETNCVFFTARDMVRVTSDRLWHQPDAIIARPGQRYRMM
ncbi:MAG: AAC(3) family N-acetyltransferase [Dongiaceae bacterium]